MAQLLAYLRRRRIAVQIAAMVVLPPLAIHLLLTAFFLLHRGETPPGGPPGHDLDAVVHLVAATPAPERPSLIEAIGHAYPGLAVAVLPPDAAKASADGSAVRLPHLGGPHVAFALPGGDPDRIGVRLPDGTAIAATIDDGHAARRIPFLGGPWSTALLSIVISISLLSLWAAHTLTAPLSAFAGAAESFSLDGDAAPLAEDGPDEIRRAARAFNRMRERITALMRDRTQMLAAISHDLRTPITRLRLRCEFIEDESQRRQTLRDLDQMRGMLDSVLSLLRNGRAGEPRTLVDLPALLQVIRDQFADLGHDVALSVLMPAVVEARPDDLGRAVTNLVENAVRFGAHVEIILAVTADGVVIEVADNGPGIADARKAEMMEPFVRGDAARNLDDEQGFGLGLAITRSIIAAHGGTLSLHDRAPHGLVARVTLPVDDQPTA